jgi:hypothetical protein
MAVHYLRHFIHGTKVACSDMEVEYDKKQGWVPYDPSEKPIIDEVIESEPLPEEPVDYVLTKRPYNRKPKE